MEVFLGNGMYVGKLIVLILMTIALTVNGQVMARDLAAILDGNHRSEENKARDQYRHPQQVIQFLGLKPEHKVLEVWPGSGWYSEILAPYVKDKGQFYAAIFSPDNLNSDDKQRVFWSKVSQKYQEKMADTSVYGSIYYSVFDNARFESGTLPEVVDVIMLVRTLHVWDERGEMQDALKSLFKVLKPGGVLGLIQHRADTISEFASSAGDGYMDQRYVIEAAEQAGFKLEAVSEINRNDKDTKDYPKGVYALPPTLAMGSQDREKYQNIGESDRMTLKFTKPVN